MWVFILVHCMVSFFTDFWPNLNILLEHQIKLVLSVPQVQFARLHTSSLRLLSIIQRYPQIFSLYFVIGKSLRCIEHPQTYSWYPPHESWYPPMYRNPPVYSRYPPNVFIIPPQYTEHSPVCLLSPIYWTHIIQSENWLIQPYWFSRP